MSGSKTVIPGFEKPVIDKRFYVTAYHEGEPLLENCVVDILPSIGDVVVINGIRYKVTDRRQVLSYSYRANSFQFEVKPC